MRYWVIRAGEGGKYFDEFIKYDVIAIGWNKIRNLRKIHVKAALEALHKKAYPRETKGAQAINIG